MIWIVVANACNCRIINYEKNPANLSAIKDSLNSEDQIIKRFSVVKEFIHPETRLRDVDLAADKPGRYKRGSTVQSDAYNPRETVKENEMQNFAKEIVKEIEDGLKSNKVSQLVLVAPAHMIGLLHNSLNSHSKSFIKFEISKDYNKLSERELILALKNELPPAFLTGF